MASRSVLLLLAVVALACGSQVSRESYDGGSQGSSGGSGAREAGSSGGGSGDDSSGGPGDDAGGTLDAGQGIVFPIPVVPPQPPVTCMGPWLYGTGSGSGETALGYEELCTNGHLYMAYCQHPTCACECVDELPDASTGSYTQMCPSDPYGFSACGFPVGP